MHARGNSIPGKHGHNHSIGCNSIDPRRTNSHFGMETSSTEQIDEKSRPEWGL